MQILPKTKSRAAWREKEKNSIFSPHMSPLSTTPFSWVFKILKYCVSKTMELFELIIPNLQILTRSNILGLKTFEMILTRPFS